MQARRQGVVFTIPALPEVNRELAILAKMFRPGAQVTITSLIPMRFSLVPEPTEVAATFAPLVGFTLPRLMELPFHPLSVALLSIRAGVCHYEQTAIQRAVANAPHDS